MTNGAEPEPGIESIAKQAVACSACFHRRLAERASVDLAQPRWIGPDYWTADPRTVIVMLNPGSGAFRADGAHDHLRNLLHGFAKGATPLEAVFTHQARDIPHWGRGRFKAFFLDEVGLQLDRIALVNIALCATKGNTYPPAMLEACFARHTLPLLRLLRPDRIVLSGSDAHPFAERIRAVIPHARVLPTLHYAHRKGNAAQRLAVEQLRNGLVP
jgi:hypothetical protein